MPAQASVTPPNTSVPAPATLPQLLAQSANGDGQCNADIAGGSPLQALQSIVTFLTGNNFYVVPPWSLLQGPCACLSERLGLQHAPDAV